MATTVSSILLVVAFLFIQNIEHGLCSGASFSRCLKSERDALLDFKEGLEDHTNRLSTWTGEECCNWEGVACNNKTGHVVRLDLQNPHPTSHVNSDTMISSLSYNRWCLGGKLNPSLLGLKHLSYLDLSMNNFGGICIPKFIGSFNNLIYLNLSNAGFNGLIPHQLGNLSRLQYLDIHNDFDYTDTVPNYSLIIDDAMWISGLSSLKHLNMDGGQLQNVNWVEALNMVPSIVEIRLFSCGLDHIPLSLPHVNFTHLSVLDLSNNMINSVIPLWLFNISRLSYIDLSSNSFEGSIPSVVGNLTSLNVLVLADNNLDCAPPKDLGGLCKLHTLDLSKNNVSKSLSDLGEVFLNCIKYSLENLDLSYTNLSGHLPNWLVELRMLTSLTLYSNSLSGSIPEWLGSMSALQELNLGDNYLNGTLPESIGCLSNLVTLHLEFNILQGIISEAHFSNLSKLENLCLSATTTFYQVNKLVLKVSPDWVPPFHLKTIMMSSCAMGPQFPPWLQTQANLSSIVISNNGIIGTLPDWFWNFFTHYVDMLDISGNGITGKLPDLSGFHIRYIDLSSNYFEGHLPNLSAIVTSINLSNNSFSGLIHYGIEKSMPRLVILSLSRNKLSGVIPLSLCKLENLIALDLSRNFLSGKLPDCWKEVNYMQALKFAGNNLSGGIPYTFGSMTLLESLHLSNNSLTGELPSFLRRCKLLVSLDLGQNKFTGIIPNWIAESFPMMRILRLRSNMFTGEIPPNLSRLRGLQILDFGNNNLSGTIPQSFGNITAMKFTRLSLKPVLALVASPENIDVMIEGREHGYSKLLSLVTIMDISNNRLSGEIPREIGNLSGLVGLNLAGNNLIGKLPEELGLLYSMEFFDLSGNELSGAIPSSMSSLTFLSYLNLSYNNLSGEIPSGNQFHTFSNQSYIGNPGLCGFPLSRLCHNESKHSPVDKVEDEVEDEESDIWWLFVSMALGLVVGSLAFWGTLLLKNNWKDAYFQHVDYIYNRIYVARIKQKHNVTV